MQQVQECYEDAEEPDLMEPGDDSEDASYSWQVVVSCKKGLARKNPNKLDYTYIFNLD